jgi:hypothetical protein
MRCRVEEHVLRFPEDTAPKELPELAASGMQHPDSQQSIGDSVSQDRRPRLAVPQMQPAPADAGLGSS